MTFVDWFDKILEFFGSYLILYLGAIASVSAEKDFDSSTWAKDWCWQNGGKENLIEVIQSYLEDGRVLRPDLDDDDDQQDDGQDYHQDNAWRNVVSKNSFCLSSWALLSWKMEWLWQIPAIIVRWLWWLLWPMIRRVDELLTASDFLDSGWVV